MRIAPRHANLRTGERIELRSPEAQDGAAVLAFIRQLSTESFRNLNHPPDFFASMTVSAEAALLDAYAQHPKNVFIAAFLGDTVIGTTNMTAAASTFAPHCAELGRGVLEDYESLGFERVGTLRHVARLPEGLADEHLYQRVEGPANDA